MNNLSKLAEQQRIQREIKIEIKILKQTHDKKLAEILSPVTKKLVDVNESSKNLGECVRNSVEDENTQPPAIEILATTQSLRDISTLVKRSQKFFKFAEKSNGEVFWNGVFLQPLGENRIDARNEEYDLTPNL